MAERTCRRRRPTAWLIASAVMLLLYVYSVGWLTLFTTYSDGYRSRVAMASGAVRVDRMHKPGLSFLPPRSAEVQFAPGLHDDYWARPSYVNSRKSEVFIVNVPLWLFALPVWIITFITWRRCRRHPPGACRKCGYDLHGLPPQSSRCPECGGPVHG